METLGPSQTPDVNHHFVRESAHNTIPMGESETSSSKDKKDSPPVTPNDTEDELGNHASPNATAHAQDVYSDAKASQPAEPDVVSGADDVQNQPEAIDELIAPTLYCATNGRLHSSLLDFGYQICPKCWQNLTGLCHVQEAKSESSSVDGRDSVTSPIDNHPTETSEVIHTVRFEDMTDNYITTETWDGPFNLTEERRAIRRENSLVFSVLTTVKTTIDGAGYRSPDEVAAIKKAGIINNPAIGVDVISSEIVINSTALIGVFRSIDKHYPSAKVDSRTVSFKEPYAFLVHHLDLLEARRGRSEAEQSAPNEAQSIGDETQQESDIQVAREKHHLDLLLGYIYDIYQDRITKERKLHEQGRCTFSMLWLLLEPGTTVYSQSSGRLAAYVISSVETDQVILSKNRVNVSPTPYKIFMWSLEFDGTFVRRSGHCAVIRDFVGERDITTLGVFPGRYQDTKDGGRTRRELEDGGEKWFRLLKGGYIHYSGKLFDSNGLDLHTRVYVDNVSYYRQEQNWPQLESVNDTGDDQDDSTNRAYNLADFRFSHERPPNCICDECFGLRPHPPAGFAWASYDLLDPLKERGLTRASGTVLSAHHYLLCGRKLHGLVLKTRKWAILDAANCQPPKIDGQAIRSLVMPESRKIMIEALVQRFAPREGSSKVTSWRADHMENKGEGQIFLLHGSPGVGKTFVKCIAEYTGKALLSLTCGDIGTDDATVESNLTKWFELAETWGAILLIDEADIYLERREINDLKRNSLVSVFLRCIEYYRGILFLTTNRVGTFDDAFMSRIHVVIYYEKLGPKEQAKIWQQFFDKLDADRTDFRITSRARDFVVDDDYMRQFDWNGREIRNAFQTAVTLAEYRYAQHRDNSGKNAPTLDQCDFKSVCDMTVQFKQYLLNVHGEDEDGRAAMRKARAFEEDRIVAVGGRPRAGR